jgi:hypothetical protein
MGTPTPGIFKKSEEAIEIIKTYETLFAKRVEKSVQEHQNKRIKR